jgi:hypothetical protein
VAACGGVWAAARGLVPALIAGRLATDYPEDQACRVSHEAMLLCVVKRYFKIESWLGDGS